MSARERSRAVLSGILRHYTCRGRRRRAAPPATLTGHRAYVRSCVVILVLLVLPPAVPDDAKDGQGGNRQIDDAFIQRLCGAFTQLLGGTRTNRALCVGGFRRC